MSTHYYRFTLRGAEARRRAPTLERLLARADAFPVTEWRADAFRAIAPQAAMPGVAAAALCAEQGSVRGASVFLATPVHYEAEMSTVRLAADGILSLQQPEADALAADFNRVWHGAGVRMLAGRCADVYCVFDQALVAVTRDPDEVLGEPIVGHLPAGDGARRLRQLMSEMELWLFDHEVNRARSAAPAVTGLWLWGGGPVLQSLPPVSGWTRGGDAFFRAFGTSPGAGAGADTAADSDSGVAVIGAPPGSTGWSDAERRWLLPSAAAWRAGRLERLDLSADGRCFSLTARARWRFWRRSRPWWEHFE